MAKHLFFPHIRGNLSLKVLSIEKDLAEGSVLLKVFINEKDAEIF
jgi:hypothetical protein